MAYLRPAVVMTALFILLTGIAYPLAITGVAQLVFPAQANGSLVMVDGTARGSRLIGQAFGEPRYFWARPSATADASYNATASTGSNLGQTSAALSSRISADVEALRAAGIEGPIPADGVTASGSGLDPDITPDYARAQAKRVAAARGIPVADVLALVDHETEGRVLGIVGEPRVNVLDLNMALDQRAAK